MFKPFEEQEIRFDAHINTGRTNRERIREFKKLYTEMARQEGPEIRTILNDVHKTQNFGVFTTFGISSKFGIELIIKNAPAAEDKIMTLFQEFIEQVENSLSNGEFSPPTGEDFVVFHLSSQNIHIALTPVGEWYMDNFHFNRDLRREMGAPPTRFYQVIPIPTLLAGDEEIVKKAVELMRFK